MNKIFLFIILVVAGVSAILIFANKTNIKMPDLKGESTSSDQTQVLTPTQVVSEPSVNSPTVSPTPEENKISKAVIKTSKGDITLTLFSDKAPNTVKNFSDKVKSGFYNNLTFHRVEDWVIQGGDPSGNGTGGGKMPTELNSEPFIVGSLGVARGQDIKVSNDAQFFITKTDASWLNNQYTNFGIVTSGMDVVKKIEIGEKILGISIGN